MTEYIENIDFQKMEFSRVILSFSIYSCGLALGQSGGKYLVCGKQLIVYEEVIT
jgi:hypothetical protein